MRIRLLVAVVVLSVVAVSAPAPVAASYYEDGISFSTQITRDSRVYRLNVKAIEAMGGGLTLEVSLRTNEDPEGVTFLRQKQTWTFGLEREEFFQTEDGYRIDVGGPGRPLDVHLTIAGGETPCEAGQPLYVAQDEGTEFRIETGNDVFGTITELPECGRHYSFADGPRPGPPPCPVSGITLHTAISVSEVRNSGIARFSYTKGEERALSGEPVAWELVVKGKVEGSAFYLSRRLSGRFSGLGSPWLSGVARLNPVDPLQRTGWDRCRGGRESRKVYRYGDLGGDLQVEVIGEGYHAVTWPDVYLERAWVRPRS